MLDIAAAPAELRVIARALRAVGPELRREINARTRDTMGPVWKAAVDKRLTSAVDRRVIGAGVRIKAGNPPVAMAAQSRRRTRGGLIPSEDWPAFEFGPTSPDKRRRYRSTSPKGKGYSITRHVTRQLPARDKSGRIAWAALTEVAPRAVSLWAATCVRTIYDAAEGR